MATEEEKTWGARLEEGGYIIEGINLQNDAMMEAIYTLLEMTKDFPKQSQLRAFIKKQQEANAPSQNKKQRVQKSCLTVMKKSPLDIRPPPPPEKPQFVCPADWKDEVKLTIQGQLDMHDLESSESHRVEPLAVSRCSRGGKTRALTEIANMGFTCGEQDVPVIFISFNDYSTLEDYEQEDPLQALLVRIAFAAWEDVDYKPGSTTKELLSSKFQAFRRDYVVTEGDVVCWLGEEPALLIVDELNNLEKLAGIKDKELETKNMANFIKEHFIKQQGRYFIFSTHILSTLECFGVYMEHASNNDRGVWLQELPLVEDLSKARTLNENLMGAREAIYYGLMPGLIHDRSKRSPQSVLVKWNHRMTQHNEKPPDERKKAFFNVLKSLISGEVDKVPTHFHTFLDATNSAAGSEIVRWSPYHLEFVLKKLLLDDSNDAKLAESMMGLCKSVLTAKEQSGDGWESLFVLFLLARCFTMSWQDPILPKVGSFFETGDKWVVLYNEPFHGLLDECECWRDLKKRILPRETPTLSIYYPTHARFLAYDVILVASEKKKITRIIGYQLKESCNNATQRVEQDFNSSLLLKGLPPGDRSHKAGWTIPSKDEIDKFFGVSGKHWTPKQWKMLAATAEVPIK